MYFIHTEKGIKWKKKPSNNKFTLKINHIDEKRYIENENVLKKIIVV